MSDNPTLDDFSVDTQEQADEPHSLSDESERSSEWGEKPLGEIFNSIYSGGTPKRGVDDYYNGSIPFVKIEDLDQQQGSGITTAEEYITEKAIEETSARSFSSGTLLITIYGSLAETAMVHERVSTNQGILGLWDVDSGNIQYIRYAINNTQAKLASLSRQTTQANLGKGIVKKHKIPIPPLSEQRKIATVLHTVDRAIQKTEEIVEQVEQTKQALTQSFFLDGYFEHSEADEAHHQNRLPRHPAEWQTKPAGEVMEVTRGAHPRPKSDDTLWRGEVPIVKIGDRNRGDSRIINSTDDTVTEKGSQKSKLVGEGTLIVSNAGTIGTARITGMQTCIHDHWLILRDYEETLSTRYLYYFINWNQEFLEALASGSTVLDLNTDDFRLFDVTFPSLEEQQKIADTLDTLHNQKMINVEYSDRLQRLKRGLMQDLLSGEVRTTDVDIDIPEEVAKYG